MPQPPTGDDANAAHDHLVRLEALLFSADAPVPPRKLASLLGWQAAAEAPRWIAALNEGYQTDGAAFRAYAAGEGYILATLPELRPLLEPWRQAQEGPALAGPALQTLAVVAYRQPIAKADIELARGAPCAETLKTLIDDGWIKVVGKEDTLGRPSIYGTTRQFLAEFGFDTLEELPELAGLKLSSGKA